MMGRGQRVSYLNVPPSIWLSISKKDISFPLCAQSLDFFPLEELTLFLLTIPLSSLRVFHYLKMWHFVSFGRDGVWHWTGFSTTARLETVVFLFAAVCPCLLGNSTWIYTRINAGRCSRACRIESRHDIWQRLIYIYIGVEWFLTWQWHQQSLRDGGRRGEAGAAADVTMKNGLGTLKCSKLIRKDKRQSN